MTTSHLNHLYTDKGIKRLLKRSRKLTVIEEVNMDRIRQARCTYAFLAKLLLV
jgi:hypothetical protein